MPSALLLVLALESPTRISSSSVPLTLVGEVLCLHVGDVLADGFGHDGKEVGIAAEELGRETLVHAQHIDHLKCP
mgnify:CR=1 FL=1